MGVVTIAPPVWGIGSGTFVSVTMARAGMLTVNFPAAAVTLPSGRNASVSLERNLLSVAGNPAPLIETSASSVPLLIMTIVTAPVLGSRKVRVGRLASA